MDCKVILTKCLKRLLLVKISGDVKQNQYRKNLTHKWQGTSLYRCRFLREVPDESFHSVCMMHMIKVTLRFLLFA